MDVTCPRCGRISDGLLDHENHARTHENRGRSVDPADAAAQLSPKDRDALASHICNLCGALLLIFEAGTHYRALHPNDRPSFTARARKDGTR